MFLSWWRSLVNVANPNIDNSKGAKRWRIPRKFRAAMTLEHLEDRVVPTGTAQLGLDIGAASPIMAASPSMKVPVFIDISNISTAGGAGGIGSGNYYVKYDPTVLSINETSVAPGTAGSDIQLGSLLSTGAAAGQYGLATAAGYAPGIVAVGLSLSGTALTGTPSGHLIELDFNVLPSAKVPAGGITSLIDLVPQIAVGKTTNQTDSTVSNKYTITPTLTSYSAALTAPGGNLTPSSFPTPDTDAADVAVQINTASTAGVTVTGIAATYNMAPNNGTFATTMNVSAAGGVVANDTTTSGGALGAQLVGVTPLPALSAAINNITESGNTATVTTTAAQTYVVGEDVSISGNSQAGYNGTYVVDSVISSTQFTYTDAANSSLSKGTGGVVFNGTTYSETTANGGVVTLSADDGSFNYTPASGYLGVDSFSYKAVDAQSGATSAPTTATINVGGLLTIPHVTEAVGSTFDLPVMIASGNPANSGGVTGAIVTLYYDATKLTFKSGKAGSLIPASWTDFGVTSPTSGEIDISTSNINTSGANFPPISATGAGSLAILTFQVLPGAASGDSLVNIANNISVPNPPAPPVQIDTGVTANGPVTLPFAIAPVNNTDFSKNVPGPTDGLVTVTGGTTSTATTTTVSSSQSTAVYGTPVTFTGTVTATTGTAAPTGTVDFFDVTTNKDLGNGTAGTPSGTSETWTFLTGAKTFNVTTGDVIKASYTPAAGTTFTASDSGPTNVTQIVTARPLTVTAVTFTKIFDGTIAAPGATPTITSGTLVTGDTATFTETYDTATAGTGKTLTPSGTVNDGNSGKNYVVTFVTDTTGVINSPAGTATTTTISTSLGSVTYGTPVTFTGTVTASTGTAAPTGTVDFFDVTTNKDLGNGTFGASTGTSSTYTFLTGAKTFNVTSGDVIKASYTPATGSGFSASDSGPTNVTQVVTARPLTVTAVTFTKTFDGTIAAPGATPTITTGTLVTGDTATFTETFDTSAQGTGKTLTPAGTVNDGNGGKNYTVTFVPDTTGAITQPATGNNTAKLSLVVGATSVIAASPSQTVTAYIDISNIAPLSAAPGGIGSGNYYVKYDPTVLSVNETSVAPGTAGSDIQLGALLSTGAAAGQYGLATASGYAPGILAIGLSLSGTPLTGTPSGHLIAVNFHVLASAIVPAGGIASLIDLVPQIGVGKTTNQTDSTVSNKYTITPTLTSYSGALTVPGGTLTPGTFPAPDTDVADVAVDINSASTTGVTVTGNADTYNMAPNNGTFATTMSVSAVGGVVANDTTSSGGALGAQLVGVTPLPALSAAINNITEVGNTATVTTTTAHTYVVGENVSISGVSQAGYNGTYVIQSVSGSTFTYTDPNSGLSKGTGGVVFNGTTYSETTANGGVVTLSADDGSFNYTPASGYLGVDSFSYKAVDAQSGATSAPTTATINVGGLLTIPHVTEAVGSTFDLPVMIASGNPANSGGVTGAIVTLYYDATKLTFKSGKAGSLIPASWTDFGVTSPTSGEIDISTSNINTSGANFPPISATGAGSLAILTFQVLPGAASGDSLVNIANNISVPNPPAPPVQIDTGVTANGPVTLPFAIAPVNNTDFSKNIPGPTDGLVTITGTGTTTATTTTVSSSQSTAVYGTPVTFTGTVTATTGTAAPTGNVDFFDVTTNTDLGNGTAGTPSGTSETWTFLTGAKTFNVTTGDVIKATYTPATGTTFTGSDSGPTSVTQIVTARPLTVTAATNTKIFDGNTSALATPTITGGTLVTGDTATSFTETYDTSAVGTGKTLTPAGSVNDGNSGKNYAITFVTDTTGAITAPAGTATTTTVSSSLPSAIYGTPVTFTGTVTATTGTAAPTGTVDFFDVTTNTDLGAGTAGTPSGTSETWTFLTGVKTFNVTAGDVIKATYAPATGSNFVTGNGSVTQIVTARSLTVTAATNTKVFDGNTSAAATPTITGGTLVAGDTATTFTETYDTSAVGTGKTLTPAGSVNDGNGGKNYAITFVTDTTGAITAPAGTATTTTVSSSLPTATYGTPVTFTGTVTATTGTAAPTGTVDFFDVTTNTDLGAGTAGTPSGTSETWTFLTGAKTFNVTAGDVIKATYAPATGSNFVTSNGSVTQIVTARSLTVTAATNTKVFDGNTSAAATPTITGGTLVAGDTATTFTETYDTSAVGTGKTLTPAGSVNDGNGGKNYAITFVNDTTGAITAPAGTATTTTVSSSQPSAVYGTPVTFTGTVTATTGTAAPTGNVDFFDVTTNTDLGNGTAGTPSGTSETWTFLTGAKTFKVTSGDVIKATYTPATGSGFVTSNGSVTQIVTARLLTVTATGVNKVYDGTTAATVTLSNNAIAGDVVTETDTSATFADKNVGVGKTVTVSGISIGGADAGNYTLSNTTATTTANITAEAITVTAATNTKVYDGTTSATAKPTISGGTLQAGDTANFTESYDTKNVGTGKTLTPSGTITDGNSGNNYTVTFKNDTTGAITAKALTVTATGVNKVYDGTTAATVTLSNNAIAGDVVTETDTSATFADKNVGVGKTVTVSGISIGGADAGNYTLSNTTATTTANITAEAITVTAATNTKVYDGTTSATAKPTISGGTLQAGDTANFTESYDTKNVGTGKTLTPSGTITDGNSGNNYTVTFKNDTTGAITAKALTVTATGVNKVYDGTTAATVTLSNNAIAGDVVTETDTSATFADKNVGVGKTVTVSGISIGGADAGNYTLSNTTATTTANITAEAITVTATTNTKLFDNNTSAAAIPTITGGALATGDTAAFTETYDTPLPGTGKTLTPAGTVNDGNGGNNYTVTFMTNTTGTITPTTPPTGAGITADVASVTEPKPGDPNVAYGFTITLAKAPTQAVTVYYMTRDGSATAGEDFLGINSGHITFQPGGSLSQHITIWIKSDAFTGVDPETFSVVLTSAYNTTINGTAKSATGSIKQQPAAAANSVNIAATYTQSVSTSTVFNVPVTLTAAANQPVTVYYKTGGPTDTAVAGVDYVGVGSGHITIQPGDTSAVIPITVKSTATSGSTFTVTLTSSSSAGVPLGVSTSIVTIANPQLAAHALKGPAAPGGVTLSVATNATNSDAQLASIVTTAEADWVAAGYSAAKFSGVQFNVANLGNQVLASTSGSVITIDASADGYGWYVGGSTTLAKHMDLATVVEHELGHILGLSDVPGSGNSSNIMAEYLDVGVQRVPTAKSAALDHIFTEWTNGATNAIKDALDLVFSIWGNGKKK